MKHQAAYSLLYLSGNKAPSQDEVEKFMKTCGVSVDKATLTTFFKQIDGKTVPELVQAGHKKHVKMPAMGGGGGGAAAGGASAGAAAAAPAEEKKEEVEAVDMGGLFGDDDDY